MSPTPDTTVIPRVAATAGEPPEHSLESTLAATRRLGAVAAAAAAAGPARGRYGHVRPRWRERGRRRGRSAPPRPCPDRLGGPGCCESVRRVHRACLALHPRSSGTVLILVATGCALTGDLLGIVGRTVQHAAAQTALMGGSAPSVAALDQTQRSLNAFGFVLVAVSFATFGSSTGARVTGGSGRQR